MVKRSESAPLDFKGFSAFVGHSSAASAAVQMSRRRSTSTLEDTAVASPPPQATSTPQLRPSPVYLGSDVEITMIFRRIGQKKDATTKIRSIQELASMAFPVACKENLTTPVAEKTDLKKSDQIAALSHYFFLFQTKLVHDNNPLVRNEAIKLMGNAILHVPKAFATLLLYQGTEIRQEHDGARVKVDEHWTGFGLGNTIGHIYASRGAYESVSISKVASETFSRIVRVLRDKFKEEDSTMQNSSDEIIDKKVIRTIREYIIAHIEAILLSSSRPVTLHQALRGKINNLDSPKDTDSKPVTKSGKKASVNDSTGSEQDDLEERYERIVISCLKALSLLLQEYPETRNNEDEAEHLYYTTFNNPSLLWKHMNSSRASFRRETYLLLSTTCQYGSSLVHPWASLAHIIRRPHDTEAALSAHLKMHALITQATASEREPANIQALFEMLLVYIHSLNILSQIAWSEDDPRRMLLHEIKVDVLVKTLSKPLRHACYGSPASGWAPILLPIIASVPNHFMIQLMLVKHLWEGCSTTSVYMDKIPIVSAVAEVCGYLLVSSPSSESDSFEAEKEVAQLLVESISFYLSESSVGAESSYNLCKILSKVLIKLDAIPSKEEKHRFSFVCSYFWKEALPTVFNALVLDVITVGKINALITGISVVVDARGQSQTDRRSHFPSLLKLLFLRILNPQEGFISDEKICLLRSIFVYGGANYILSKEEEPTVPYSSVENFILSTVLLFLMPRVSSISTLSPNTSTIEDIFTILFLALLIVHDSIDRKKLWEALISELIKAGVCAAPLSVGLSIFDRLAKEKGLLNFSVDVIQCHNLNSFVLQLAESITIDPGYDCALAHHQFLLFHGIDDGDESYRDLYDFISICLGVSSQQFHSSIISTEVVNHLVNLATSNQYDVSSAKMSNLLLKVLLKNRIVISDSFYSSSLLSAAWRRGGDVWDTLQEDILNGNYDHVMSSFTDDCFSFLITALSKPFSKLDPRECSLSWSERTWRLYNICKENKREIMHFFAERCGLGSRSIWISALDEDDLNSANLLYMCLARTLKKFDDSNGRYNFLFNGNNESVELMAAVLSALCLPISITWSPSCVKRCDDLLLLLNASNKLTRIFHEKVVICLVDSLNTALKTKNISCRATKCTFSALDYLLDHVIGRVIYGKDSASMGRVKDNGNFIVADQNQSDFIHIVESKLHEMIKIYISPPFESHSPIQLEIAAEACSLLISRCGLGGKAGLGSRKYDLFITLTSLSDRVKNSLSTMNMIPLEWTLLKSLSLAMGYGCVIAPSKQNFSVISVDCKMVLSLIPLYLKDHALSKELSSSVTIFSSVVSPIIEYNDDVWFILDTVSCYLRDGRFTEAEELVLCQLLLKAIDSIGTSFLLDHSRKITEMNAYATTLAICSRCFYSILEAKKQADNHDIISSQEISSNVMIDAYEAFLGHLLSLPTDTVIIIAKCCVEETFHILYTDLRWKVFVLFMRLAKNSDGLHIENTPTLAMSTTVKLDALLSTITDTEEGEELREDFVVSARWLPRSIMLDLESWDDQLDELSDEAITSRFLSWLLCLEFLDSASRSDIRNKSHLSSYFESIHVIKTIMTLVLMCANFQDRDKAEWRAYITMDLNESLEISQLASLVLFRTFESAPALMKVWWNDDCPKALQPSIAKFVETRVAPETLRREIDRMKKEANLSDLVISGSVMSREVTASYIQDECNLSVLIRIPSLFPLRNVEVDCNKTFGISEKRWRHWSLQIMRMLNSQDGSVLDALLLWKQNVDKEFEGVEPCPVCYSVLSVKTHSMPNLECKTCHNRFHNHCLYKWFQSSGKNLCVLCQQPWSGSKLL